MLIVKGAARLGAVGRPEAAPRAASAARLLQSVVAQRGQQRLPAGAGLQPELSTGFDLRFEHYPANGGVLSIDVFYRQIDDLIRRSVRLESGMAPDITKVPRWVSRPLNIGQAMTRGLELEIKGRGEEWLPALFDKDSGVNLRAALSLYRSQVEQVDGFSAGSSTRRNTLRAVNASWVLRF